MRRTVQSYAGCIPSAVASGSAAQMQFFVADAKADIAVLADIVQRVARLNPDAGEIGAGMLASLVADAKRHLA